MALMRYLVRDRNGTYYFRRPIPEHLRLHMPGRFQGKTNWKKTLGTKEPTEAKRRYGPVLVECNRGFELAEMRHRAGERDELSGDEIAALAAYYRDSWLADDDEFRETAYLEDEAFYREVGRDLQKRGIAFKAHWPLDEPINPHRLSDRQMTKQRNDLEFLQDGVAKALAAADTSWVGPEVDLLLEAFGARLNRDKPSGALSYRRMCLAILAAMKEACELRLKRLDGEVVPTPANIATPGGDGLVPHKASASRPASGSNGSGARSQQAQRGGIKLTEALALWKRLQRPRRRSEDEFERAVNLFVELKGDMPVVAIGRSDAVDFRDALQKMPLSKHRKGRLKDALMPKLIAWAEKHPEAQRLAPGTVNKNLTGLQAICETARDDGKIEAEVWENPFKVRRVAGEPEQRLGYDADDLGRIFVLSPIYTNGLRQRAGGGEAAFWLPLLGLFHGSREEELAQLLVEDVRCEEDVWHYLIIADDGSGQGPAKRVKVAGKRLRVPLHSEVLRCGFLDYWRGRRDRAGLKARLFGDLKQDSRGRFAGNWSKWFGRWCRDKLGITDKRKVFHSFRHAWKDAARAAGIDEAISDAITGHSGGGQGRRYGNAGYPLKVLHEAIERIRFPVDLGHLHGTKNELAMIGNHKGVSRKSAP